MTQNQNSAPQSPSHPNLAAHYRPIGLKAVIAAALMLKRKPVQKTA